MIKSKYIFSLLLFTACVEVFDPQVDEADSQPIIVDALLTNQNIKHSVTINQAKNIDDTNQLTPITDADVYVEDNSGQIFNFEYIKNGIYLSENAFAGEVGNSYKLVIRIDEQLYESSSEELRRPIDIIDIHAKSVVEQIQSETGEVENELRVQISADIIFLAGLESYYRFDWQGTYQAVTPSQGSTVCWTERGANAPTDLDASKICYITDRPSSFLKLFSSEGLQGTEADSVLIYSITPNKRFQIKYSPEIILYNISQTAFEFWEAVENQTKNSGSLFDSPPSPINGNIQAVGPDGDRVIGIFEVASVSKRREFFLPSVAGRSLPNYDNDCTLEPGPFGDPPPPRPFSCCDCQFLLNSSSVKPSFWED